MRVLFIVPYALSHIRTRSYNLVRYLAKQHDITVLTLCSNEREVEEMQELKQEGIVITAILEKRSRQFLRSVRAIGTKRPLQVVFGASPRLREAIDTQVASRQFDVLHIEALRSLQALPDNLPIPVIWDEVDCMSQSYELGAQFGATPMLRIIGHMEAKRIRPFEQLQLQLFHHVLVVSERDRQALLEVAQDSSYTKSERRLAKIMVLPNGVDRNYFRPYSGVRQPGTLVFSGTMSFHANVASSLILAEQIMPHIWKHQPDTRLVIVGSKPPAKVLRLGHDPRIKVTGFVPDMRPYIAQAQVAVCPLPYATGMQNKILEAMALGTPVVTSSSGSAGLQAVPGQDFLVNDEPEAFAASVLKLIDDQVLWSEISKRGQAYVTNYHNWEDIVEQLTSIYHQAIAAFHRTNSSLLIR